MLDFTSFPSWNGRLQSIICFELPTHSIYIYIWNMHSVSEKWEGNRCSGTVYCNEENNEGVGWGDLIKAGSVLFLPAGARNNCSQMVAVYLSDPVCLYPWLPLLPWNFRFKISVFFIFFKSVISLENLKQIIYT